MQITKKYDYEYLSFIQYNIFFSFTTSRFSFFSVRALSTIIGLINIKDYYTEQRQSITPTTLSSTSCTSTTRSTSTPVQDIQDKNTDIDSHCPFNALLYGHDQTHKGS